MADSLRRPPIDGADTIRALLERARLDGDADAISTDIIGSWRRSAGAGLRPEILDVPYEGSIDDRGRLAWAAEPILQRIGEDLSGSEIGLLLTDERGLVINRQTPDRSTSALLDDIHLAPGFSYGEDRIGTNAIGTALQLLAPTVVQGEQHFAHALTNMACAATPVTDPRTGRVLGVVDLSCRVGGANALMLPLVKRAAWEIEQRLLDDGESSERLLRDRFRKATRTTRVAVIGISGQSLLSNAAATAFVDGADHGVWWGLVQQSLVASAGTCALMLSDGTIVTMRCQAVVAGSDIVGALLSADLPRRSSAKDFGWDSLTDTELAVAAQISTGMTNKEAAARLFVSPHTIDFHLRQLFRKLGVRSRVELTRVVLEHQDNASSDRVGLPTD